MCEVFIRKEIWEDKEKSSVPAPIPKFSGLTGLDPLVRGTDPDPDPSSIKQK
jgi:hypothetical protein